MLDDKPMQQLDEGSLPPEIEGVIKFNLDHTPGIIELPPDLLAELNSWRLLLFRLEMIGQDHARYDGLAFGNISQRLDLQDHRFVISGTQTSGKELLKILDLSVVTEFKVTENFIQSYGESKPSSEALTHAAVYLHKPAAQVVIHVHDPGIWHCTQALQLAHTAADIAYGTPELAEAVAVLLSESILTDSGMFTLLGHVDGIVAFGTTFEEATKHIVLAWVAAQRLLKMGGS